MSTLPLTACPVCGGAEADTASLGAGRHRRCRRCGAVYAAEYADPSTVFDEGYFADEGTFGIDVRHPRFQRYLADVGARRAAAVERARGGPGTMLDVGCGTGEAPAAAAARGWRVTGIELIGEAAADARERFGLDVHVGTLDTAPLDPEARFDVVCAYHVLEHLEDSRAFLRALAARARPGGHVVVEVPNLHSSARRASGAAWVHLRPLEHLVHFTPETLRRALDGADLEPVDVSTPTWLHPEQTLDEALGDLGLLRWRRPLGALTRSGGVDGRAARVPTAAGWAALRALERLQRRRGRGMVCLAIARVPA